MKVKTETLKGAALDWAVAKAEGVRTYTAPYQHTTTGLCVLDADLVDMETDGPQELRYSRDWSQGGPIIEREGIEILCNVTDREAERFAEGTHADWFACLKTRKASHWHGQTPLVAAIRCYVASRLGEEVDIPEELTR